MLLYQELASGDIFRAVNEGILSLNQDRGHLLRSALEEQTLIECFTKRPHWCGRSFLSVRNHASTRRTTVQYDRRKARPVRSTRTLDFRDEYTSSKREPCDPLRPRIPRDSRGGGASVMYLSCRCSLRWRLQTPRCRRHPATTAGRVAMPAGRRTTRRGWRSVTGATGREPNTEGGSAVSRFGVAGPHLRQRGPNPIFLRGENSAVYGGSESDNSLTVHRLHSARIFNANPNH